MSTTTRKRVFTPPRWLNALMRGMLRTPGLQRLVGRSTALLTFSGRRTGATYTTPVTYVRRGDTVLLTADPSRQWWRNVAARPEVSLRLAGGATSGTARVLRGAEALDALTAFFAAQPLAARAAGLSGDWTRADVAARLDDTVVVAVDLA